MALVTGGGRGIGRAIAVELARQGADVAVNYRHDRDAATDTVAEIESLGRVARAYAASVDDADEDEALVEAVLGDFGGVDILVANAGIASRGHRVADTDPDETAHVIAVHALSAHHLCRLLVPQMRERERGDIVLISSIATRQLNPKGAPYNMAKAAIEALAITLAKEEKRHGIRVNVIAPGLVATDMGDRLAKATVGAPTAVSLDGASGLGRVVRPQDVADAVAYLVSDRASLITGQRIEVDSGWRE